MGYIENLQKRFKNRVVEAFELSEDIVFGSPSMKIIANSEILVENHDGVTEYSPKCIRLRTPLGGLIITGSRLVIKHIMFDEVLIKGVIEKVEFDSWGGK
jgi:sporulation protein YqfC